MVFGVLKFEIRRLGCVIFASYEHYPAIGDFFIFFRLSGDSGEVKYSSYAKKTVEFLETSERVAVTWIFFILTDGKYLP